MKLFSSFRKKLVRRYLTLTATLLCLFAALIYGSTVLFVYRSTIEKAHLIATEEAEELAYIASGSKPLCHSTKSEKSGCYLNDVFYYMFSTSGALLKSHNNITWSEEPLTKCIEEKVIDNGSAHIKTVITSPKRRLRLLVIARENAYQNGRLVGVAYAGFDCSRSLMFLGRLLLITVCLLALGLYIAYKISGYLANKAMQPIINSFARQMQFAANASHELRTPLTVLMSGLDVLGDDEENHLSSFSREVVGDMKDEVLKMRHLIDNLLLLARAGKAPLSTERKELLLLPLINACCEKIALAAAKKELSVEIKAAPEEMIKAYADKTHVEQIIAILLDNAVKYAEAGHEISVCLSCGKGYAYIDVVNTGSFLNGDELKHIFERFYRGEKTKGQEGSGLGLAIALALAEKNGGNLRAASDGKNTAEFILALPQKR